MQAQIKYKFIAAFLLMVFSLNTVAGFACSIGIDMGYNTKHHQHQEAKLASVVDQHSHAALHHHPHKNSHYSSATSFNSVNTTDDCCANDVMRFARLDKSVATNNLLLQAPVFLLAFVSSYVLNDNSNLHASTPQKFPCLQRRRFLNDTDIRIHIQSFQI